MQCKMELPKHGIEPKSGPVSAMTGSALAKDVISRFRTRDVFALAQSNDITIVYQRWFPVTLGEFDGKRRQIVVNQNAQIPQEKIIAHELGHYFLAEAKLTENSRVGSFDEEMVCDDFADQLLSNG